MRDPSVYVKRSDLATPSGIDHDYNYLTSIERQLDNAERDATERGFLLQSRDNEKPIWRYDGLDGPRKGEMPMKAAIERCGVVVERAPEGMARRKQNATHWDRKCALKAFTLRQALTGFRKQRLIWTVEWIYDNGRRAYGTCPESEPLWAAYVAHFTSTKVKARSKNEDITPRKKRQKRGVERLSSKLATSPNTTQYLSSEAPIVESVVPEVGSIAPLEALSGTAKDTKPSGDKERHCDMKSYVQEIDPSNYADSLQNHSNHKQYIHNGVSGFNSENAKLQQSASSKRPNDVPIESNADQSVVQSLHFYLHAPRLPSTQPVLIPLSHDASLSISLRNRLVLEFPTIYVLECSASEMPDGYVLEEVFDKKMQQESFRDSVMAKLRGNEEGEIDEVTKQDEGVDAKKIEEVLKQDLKSLQREALARTEIR